MIIDNFYVKYAVWNISFRLSVLPDETDTPLIVDTYAVLA